MKIILYLSIFILFLSCEKEKVGKNVLSQELESKLVSKLSERGIFQAWGLIKQGKTFVLNGISGLQIIEEDELKDSTVTHVRTIGRERTSLLGEGVNGEITTLNYHTGKLMIYRGKNIARGNSKPEFIQLPKQEEHLIAAKGHDFVIATGLYEKGRYLYYSINADEANYYLSYPDHPDYPNITQKTKGILYASSVIRIHPDENSFVCGDMYSGTIDFCKIRGQAIERIKEICLHVPEVFISGRDVQYKKSNRLGFADITVSKDKVYALYSGKSYNDDPKHFAACQVIMEFDWSGNILNTYKIDQLVTSINFDSEENSIYAICYSPDTPLLKIDL